MNQLIFKNGDKLDAIGLGTWKSEPGEVYKAVREAIKLGYRHIDCAWIYQNEKEIGNAFADAFAEGDVTRDELFVTSKLWNSFHAPEDVMPALKESLNALQLEYLDLYLIHWPIAHKKEAINPKTADDFIPIDEMPIADTWKAMEACVEAGLVKHIGVSNFNIPKLKKLMETAIIQPEMNQVESHPYLAQNDLLQFCIDNNIHYTAYSPLGSRDRAEGMKGIDEPDMFENDVVKKIAEAHNVHPAQILIKWAEARGTAVIPKSVNPERLKKNLKSAKIELSKEDMAKLNKLDKGYRFLNGKFWEREGGSYTAEGLWNN
ncbi:aldehyde oxidoreductase [Roseivirga seohaensis subsp. aquiponti]|uniref:Aldehyde oxidoreductase n=1 Tax=Roseivirga seohaensis subsp. aquiponti TaxID=1566026 RepID=A0A0L8AIZ8_9BACT|nr:aldo/keto reductase [Roseivirga seohaensis]KOF02418.1 aldehyde oxidoreductase [Roseivirga seohaensis subsp. aquiponti]